MRHHDGVGRTVEIDIRDQPTGSGATCRKILRALPHWFGLPASVDHYVVVAEKFPAVVASTSGDDVGIVTIVPYGRYAAEVYVMGVLPDLHRQGIGRLMLQHAEAGLATRGVEFLQVKTLSASKPDVGCEKTRAFYLSCGFRPLEEFPTLWDVENPALQMVKVITPAIAQGTEPLSPSTRHRATPRADILEVWRSEA